MTSVGIQQENELMSYQTFEPWNRPVDYDSHRSMGHHRFDDMVEVEDDGEMHPALLVIIALGMLLGVIAVGATIVAMLSMLTVLLVVGGLGFLFVGALVLMSDDRE
jgi:hypothetical protein